MAKGKTCPVCGSECIEINGVRQQKKGLLYYLSGQAASDMGRKAGYKAGRTLAGDKGSPNAVCLACHHQWTEA